MPGGGTSGYLTCSGGGCTCHTCLEDVTCLEGGVPAWRGVYCTCLEGGVLDMDCRGGTCLEGGVYPAWRGVYLPDVPA